VAWSRSGLLPEQFPEPGRGHAASVPGKPLGLRAKARLLDPPVRSKLAPPKQRRGELPLPGTVTDPVEGAEQQDVARANARTAAPEPTGLLEMSESADCRHRPGGRAQPRNLVMEPGPAGEEATLDDVDTKRTAPVAEKEMLLPVAKDHSLKPATRVKCDRIAVIARREGPRGKNESIGGRPYRPGQ